MAAAAGDHRARRINARADREPLVDRLFEREGRAAEVADRGEAAHQRSLRLGARGKQDVANIAGQERGDREPGEDRVPMGVDHPRHERASAAIDELRAFRRREVVRRDRLDPPALDEKTKAALQGFRPAVEQQEIREDDGAARAGRLGRRAGRKAKRSERGAHARNEAPPRELAVDPPRDRTDFRRMAGAADVRAHARCLVSGLAGKHGNPSPRR